VFSDCPSELQMSYLWPVRMWFQIAIFLVSVSPWLVLSENNFPALQAQHVLKRVDANLGKDPNNPRLLTIRGAALQALGRDREALGSFTRALAISPKFMAALEGAAQSGYRTRNPKTIFYLTRILQQEPDNSTAHAMAGELAFERADCTEANRHFAAAGSDVTNNAGALQHWGRCLLVASDAHNASLRLQTATTMAPQDHGILLDYALALFMDSRYDSALDVLKTLQENGRTLNLKANIYAAQNNFSEAIATFRQALEMAPKDEQNYLELASLCLEHQSFDVAREVVNAGIGNLPDSAALLTLRGAIAAQTADVEQSAADFERAQRLQPSSTYGDVALSLLLRQQDRLEEAINLIRKRLAGSLQDSKLNFLLADLLLQRHSPTENTKGEAERLLREAIRLNPKFARAHAALGKLLLGNGQASVASAELERALKEDPNDRVALNQYILALKQLGKTQEAKAAAQHLRDILAEDRADEVRKNRVRFVLNSDSRP
jgi:tetratricopeptide (TPR) repeat protein